MDSEKKFTNPRLLLTLAYAALLFAHFYYPAEDGDIRDLNDSDE